MKHNREWNNEIKAMARELIMGSRWKKPSGGMNWKKLSAEDPGLYDKLIDGRGLVSLQNLVSAERKKLGMLNQKVSESMKRRRAAGVNDPHRPTPHRRVPKRYSRRRNILNEVTISEIKPKAQPQPQSHGPKFCPECGHGLTVYYRNND